jgi:N-formylglutamate amidohydrolase
MEHHFNSYSIKTFHAHESPEQKLIANFNNGLYSIVANDEQPRLPIVLNSPHSGNEYPLEFIESSHLNPHLLRRSEDYYADALFSGLIAYGAPMIRANFPRAYLDLNREPYEFDQKLFKQKLPERANTKSIRVANGLGTIARVVSEGMVIYKKPLTLDEALARINLLYHPYHESLLELLGQAHDRFGYSILIDCHSMPSHFDYRKNGQKPDIIIGDRYGSSCNPALSQALMLEFKALGYHVVRNTPFAGGFNCEHYGRPEQGIHAAQIEINRALYVDEKTYLPSANFNQLQNHITHVLSKLETITEGYFYPTNLAAE